MRKTTRSIVTITVALAAMLGLGIPAAQSHGSATVSTFVATDGSGLIYAYNFYDSGAIHQELESFSFLDYRSCGTCSWQTTNSTAHCQAFDVKIKSCSSAPHITRQCYNDYRTTVDDEAYGSSQGWHNRIVKNSVVLENTC